MKYKIEKDKIIIFGKDDFNPQQILECGQIFSYEKREASLTEKQKFNLTSNDVWVVYSLNKKAIIFENQAGFIILCDDQRYFENFFDLKTDYSKIKNQLKRFEILKEPINFGSGIRILKQDLFETLISFVISANNNIKRIQLILNKLKVAFGTKIGDFYAFPTRQQLLKASVNDFSKLGAGYRDKYLFNVLRQIDEQTLELWRTLPTKELRNKLISLSGVGPKVADCILLFGYGKGDVFPVDTWIAKMYNKFYENLDNRNKICENLVKKFGTLSGYAQQYLFYFMRSGA